MIYFYCPDFVPPSGGIQKMYLQVDVLNRNGFPAAIVHTQAGFRCNWFNNQTRILYGENVRPGANDFVVVPEVAGPYMARTGPGIRKVIFNQNCYNTFRNYPIDPLEPETPYHSPDVVAVITVSEDSAAYLRHAFPNQLVLRIRGSVDPVLFHPETKQRQIAFMSRRHHEEAGQVFNILRFRGALADFKIAEIRDLSQGQAAAILRQSAIFFSFSAIEGFGLPPAEAMLSGCVTIGFHGRGGKEFFLPEFSYPIEFGDILGFAQTAEAVLNQYRHDPAPLLKQTEMAARYIAENYSSAIEEAGIVECWRQITG